LCHPQNPKILLLNIELELKSEKENAEVRLEDPSQYQSIVDAGAGSWLGGSWVFCSMGGLGGNVLGGRLQWLVGWLAGGSTGARGRI
jgi:hypothetical protein